jgi:hypothetical protein
MYIQPSRSRKPQKMLCSYSFCQSSPPPPSSSSCYLLGILGFPAQAGVVELLALVVDLPVLQRLLGVDLLHDTHTHTHTDTHSRQAGRQQANRQAGRGILCVIAHH